LRLKLHEHPSMLILASHIFVVYSRPLSPLVLRENIPGEEKLEFHTGRSFSTFVVRA
jgi:hypothetical protein